MQVAVTGGHGFIGKKLVAALIARGDRVRILTRRKIERVWPNVEQVEGDLTCPDNDLARFLDDSDVLYHCAGEIRDTLRMRSLHVLGTERLIDAARGRIKRWVQLSSVGAYGPVRNGRITEASPEAPVGEYERTKTEADILVQSAGHRGDFSTVILRPSIVFGPSMTNRSIFQLIGAIDRGYFCLIGESGASANCIHVDNVVKALLLCGEKPEAAGRTYLLSDHCAIEQWAAFIANALGRPIPKLRIPENLARTAAFAGQVFPGFPLTESRVDALTGKAYYSNARIEHELGYRHSIGLEDGAAQMVSEWRQQFKKQGS